MSSKVPSQDGNQLLLWSPSDDLLRTCDAMKQKLYDILLPRHQQQTRDYQARKFKFFGQAFREGFAREELPQWKSRSMSPLWKPD